MKKIAIASDHAGYDLKEIVIAHLKEEGYSVNDFGTDSNISVDYPDYIRPAAISVATGNDDLGVVLGGSGNGEAMAANKVRGIRCALCWNEQSARLAKEHNNANMISLGARMVSEQDKTLGALKTAIQMEIDGKEFYLKASQSSNNELGKKLLGTMAAEEDQHQQKSRAQHRQNGGGRLFGLRCL